MTPTNSTTRRNPHAAIVGSNQNNHLKREVKFPPKIPWSEDDILPPPETTAVSYREQRLAYFQTNYNLMTGVRIAGTLGGFFLIVLLNLLYKSKCKKSSRLNTPTLSIDKVHNKMDQSHHPQPLSSLQGKNILLDMDRGPTLLLTTPIDLSESSTESDLSLLTTPACQNQRPQKDGRPSPKNWFLKQPIDIHIIQPTPNISPSNSEMFSRANQRRAGESERKRARVSPNHRASDSDVNSPLLVFLHAENLKFVDDTSSENIPTGHESDEESPSIGSDSVFTFAPVSRKGSGTTSTYGVVGIEEDDEHCHLTLSEAKAQVHHRDSFCSSELDSDYFENQRRRSSSTQTTFSDLRRTLRLNTQTPNGSNYDMPCLHTHFLSPETHYGINRSPDLSPSSPPIMTPSTREHYPIIPKTQQTEIPSTNFNQSQNYPDRRNKKSKYFDN